MTMMMHDAEDAMWWDGPKAEDNWLRKVDEKASKGFWRC